MKPTAIQALWLEVEEITALPLTPQQEQAAYFARQLRELDHAHAPS